MATTTRPRSRSSPSPRTRSARSGRSPRSGGSPASTRPRRSAATTSSSTTYATVSTRSSLRLDPPQGVGPRPDPLQEPLHLPDPVGLNSGQIARLTGILAEVVELGNRGVAQLRVRLLVDGRPLVRLDVLPRAVP